MKARRIAGLVLTSLLASCGGSGGGAISPPSVPGVPGGQHPGAAQLKITIPSTHGATGSSSRKAQFVGSDVQGANIGVAPHGSSSIVTTAFDLSSTSPLCTLVGGMRTCTMSVAAPIGSDDFYVQTFDLTPVAGKIPTTAHILGQSSVSNVAVAGSGTPAPMALYVSGQISNIGLSGGPLLTYAADGAGHNTTFVLSPTDFGNQPIVAGANDPYANPITVSIAEHGGSGRSVLLLNGSPAGTNTTLTQSSQSIGVSYDGLGAPGYYAVLTFSAVGATAQSLTIAPMYVTSTSPHFSGTVLTFNGSAQQATMSISEAQGTASYTVTAPSTPPCSAAASAGSVTGSGAGGSVTITSGNAGAPACSMTIADGLGAVYTLGYSTTLTSGGITIGGVTEYTVTSPANARLSSIALGPDGNVYAGEAIGNNIDKFTATGTYTQFAVPTANANPGSLIAASDGAIWFVEKGSYKVGRMTTNGTFSEYTMPNSPINVFPQSIAQATDGTIYAIDRGLHQLDPLSIFGVFGSPTLISGSLTPTPYGVAADNTGLVYVVDPANNQIVSLSATAVPNSTPITTANSGTTNITFDPTHGLMWFSETNTNKIGQFNGTFITEYPIGQNDQPGDLTVGPDGNIWYVASGSNSIGKFNTSTNVFTHYAIPTANATPIGIAAGPDGRIWFTEYSTNKVGAITP